MVADGRARVVVGARSLFMLQLKICSYYPRRGTLHFRQEETPRYHGRDVAVYRAMLSKCLCTRFRYLCGVDEQCEPG